MRIEEIMKYEDFYIQKASFTPYTNLSKSFTYKNLYIKDEEET